MSEYSVTFIPDNIAVAINEKESLLYALNLAGIPVQASCGGKGTCGSCKIIIKEGRVKTAESIQSREEQEKGYLPACRCYPLSDLIVEVPDDSRVTEKRVLLDNFYVSESGMPAFSSGTNPGAVFSPGGQVFRVITIENPAPSLNDPTDDLSRLKRSLAKETGLVNIRPTMNLLRVLPKRLRQGGWSITVSLAAVPGGELIEMDCVEAGCENSRYYGLAVDIGTTTVAARLVDLDSGEIAGARGAFNRQSSYGDDVITRIIYCDEHGVSSLQKAILDTINNLTDELVRDRGIEHSDIKAAFCAGNTTMTHILLGLEPANIRLEPYTPVANSFPPVRASAAGLNINKQAWVHIAPGIASYVGGDITAGLLVTGMPFDDDLSLFIDIGTNGEMVLGSKEWLVSCACSAGPAFEGWGIRHGMQASPGAIEKVVISCAGEKVDFGTVENKPPRGICGSGLIDTVSWLYKTGVIDRTGAFIPETGKSRVRDSGDGREYVLARAGEAGNGTDIFLTEAEIKNLIRSKAAVYAGIRTMLKMVGLPVEAINRVYIAGGFGRQINIREAINIGMFPDIPPEKYIYVGNSVLKGTSMALLSGEARDLLHELAGKMTYLELSSGNLFMEEFISALFIPHTELSLFPTVERAAV